MLASLKMLSYKERLDQLGVKSYSLSCTSLVMILAMFTDNEHKSRKGRA